MSAGEKLTAKASEVVGEPVLAAAMVVPPGATLYRSYAPKNVPGAIGGPIAAAIASKAGGAAAGQAGSVPTSQGVLVLTATRVAYCKKKAIGVGVGEPLVEWPRSDITFSFDPSSGRYPALMLTFPDDSTCVVFGEKSWGLDLVAAAASA